MMKSMRVRMTFWFVVLLVVFGWVLTKAIAHSSQLLEQYDLAAQQHHIRFVLTTFMWLLFPVAGIGAWILVGRTLKPLRSLSQQADNSPGTRLVAPSSDKEMEELVSTINGLLDRVEATADAKSQFYAAASHELRTPLQALTGHIDTALSKERSENEYRDALVEAQNQTRRLTTLTQDILTLHQLQAQRIQADETADMVSSIEVVVRELSPLIEARNLTLDIHIPDRLLLHGRQSFSDVCVRNLIENAVRYSLQGSRVCISLSSTSLSISNDADLGDRNDLDHLFEPFGATQGVQPSNGGNGLGLAVCRAAAQVNGWSIRLERQGQRFIAIVTLIFASMAI